MMSYPENPVCRLQRVMLCIISQHGEFVAWIITFCLWYYLRDTIECPVVWYLCYFFATRILKTHTTR